MEMEVVVPILPADFNFDSNCSSPYITAPSSPQRFGNFFFSAPTSPTRSSPFFHDLSSRPSSSSVPFQWEEKPGVPKSIPTNQTQETTDLNEDFEFDFSGQLDRASLSAEELFDGGKIRALKPPPRLQSNEGFSSPVSNASSPRSRFSQGKRIFQEALLSPRGQKREFDPFAKAIEETRKRDGLIEKHSRQELETERGRERVSLSSSSSSSMNFGRKGSRSLSPMRVSDIISDHDQENSQRVKIVSSPTSNTGSSSSSSKYASFLSSISFTKGYRKWRLKDFLLFRSASEGRATSKDPLRKYAMLSKKEATEEVKNSSFRSTESSCSVSKRRGSVSAHELHYTANRAAAEEMKKKTFLPYKQGLLGCLGFNPGMNEITRGIGSLTRG